MEKIKLGSVLQISYNSKFVDMTVSMIIDFGKQIIYYLVGLEYFNEKKQENEVYFYRFLKEEVEKDNRNFLSLEKEKQF